jgi:DNA-binding response OmpR family regulator
MSKRILVVDDDPMIRNLLLAMLESQGFKVVLAEDGQQGLDLLEAEPKPLDYSLILLDVVMPGINGLDVLTRLKLKPETQSIPVVMLTGEDKAEDILAGYNVGADYYITKPFTRQQLMYGINMVLEK